MRQVGSAIIAKLEPSTGSAKETPRACLFSPFAEDVDSYVVRITEMVTITGV